MGNLAAHNPSSTSGSVHRVDYECDCTSLSTLPSSSSVEFHRPTLHPIKHTRRRTPFRTGASWCQCANLKNTRITWVLSTPIRLSLHNTSTRLVGLYTAALHIRPIMGVIRKKTGGRGSEGGVKYICDVCSVDITSTVSLAQV